MTRTQWDLKTIQIHDPNSVRVTQPDTNKTTKAKTTGQEIAATTIDRSKTLQAKKKETEATISWSSDRNNGTRMLQSNSSGPQENLEPIDHHKLLEILAAAVSENRIDSSEASRHSSFTEDLQ